MRDNPTCEVANMHSCNPKAAGPGNIFISPLRLAGLNQLKNMYNLPEVSIPVDAKTRVGYAVTLLRPSIYNYVSFDKFFDSATANEQEVYANLTSDDWNLINYR